MIQKIWRKQNDVAIFGWILLKGFQKIAFSGYFFDGSGQRVKKNKQASHNTYFPFVLKEI